MLRRIGSQIERPSLYDHLTGGENLEIARRLKFLQPADAGFAIAILGNPELLLLDEPMNGLDAEGLRSFRDLLGTLHRDHGTTILLSSHRFEEIEQVATHIGIMSGVGDLLFQGPREQLSECVPQELLIKWIAGTMPFGFSSPPGMPSNRAASTWPSLLVASGVGVHRLALDSATLEALFMKVTTTVKARDAL